MISAVDLGKATFTSLNERVHREREVIQPDNGCAESPSCLSCPLPACVLDTNNHAAATSRAQRMRDLHNEGYSIREIARVEHASMGTVHRVLHGASV